MRKKKITLLYLMLMIGIVAQAQQLNIKPYFTYHHAISAQTEPAFRNIQDRPMFSFSEDFTLANGWEVGLTAAYTFPNHLGVELGIGYFSGINNTFTDGRERVHFTVDWDYHSVAVRPMVILYGKNKKIPYTLLAVPVFPVFKPCAVLRKRLYRLCVGNRG